MDQSQEQRVAQLAAAIERMQRGDNPTAGSSLFDVEFEQALAPVKTKALALLNHRPRSRAELLQRLQSAGFAAELCETVVEICQDNGMINDATFALQWVQQRSISHKRSALALRNELKEKGISDAHITAALATLDESQQDETMRGLIDKKAQSIKQIPQDFRARNRELQRLVGVAARRGFSQSRALEYARVALENRIEELS